MRRTYNQQQIKERRRKLRNNPTPAEKLLWKHLKGKQLNGFKFRRQHSIGHFIVDFYCSKIKLAIEIDGSHHLQGDQLEYDLNRDQDILSNDVHVLRFSNQEVLNNLAYVLTTIKRHLKSPSLPGRGIP